MTNKETFIKFMDIAIEIAENEIVYQNNVNEKYNISTEEFDTAIRFWEDFKNGEVKTSGGMTENGSKVLAWMQENEEKMSNLFTSKEIAEALFTSGRSVAGSMRKLVKDEYVEKVGTNPIKYALTEAGRTYKI